MTNTLNFPGSDRHAPTARHAPALPDRIEAICFAALGAAIVYSTTSGLYITLTTPRSLPYLIVGAILLFALSVAAWLGVFHADERSSFRFLVALVIPMLLIAVPFQPGNGTGFDTYAAGRAIAIRRDAHKPAGFAHLHGSTRSARPSPSATTNSVRGSPTSTTIRSDTSAIGCVSPVSSTSRPRSAPMSSSCHGNSCPVAFSI